MARSEVTDAETDVTDDASAAAEVNDLFHQLVSLPEGDPRREDVRNRLVTLHLPVAKRIAYRFSGRGQPHEDLAQIASVGMINAVDRFDPTRGSDFLSFAIPTVMGEVRRYFRDNTWSIRVPRRLKELHLNISAATADLLQRNGRPPLPSELATYLGVTREEIYEGLEAGNGYRPLSVDAPAGDQVALPLHERIGADDPGIEHVDDHETLQPLLRALPERESKIVILRFYGNMTQSEIAERVGVSQMHVSRILSKTLEELRAKLTADP